MEKKETNITIKEFYAEIEKNKKLFEVPANWAETGRIPSIASTINVAAIAAEYIDGVVGSRIIGVGISLEAALKATKGFFYIGKDWSGSGLFSCGHERVCLVSKDFSLVVVFVTYGSKVLGTEIYGSHMTNNVEEFEKLLKQASLELPLKREINIPKIHLLNRGSNGFFLMEKNLDKDYVDIYPEEATEMKEAILKEGSGALMLCGAPGGGKSSLIGQLSGLCGETKFIYIPAHLGGGFDDPAFVQFLTEQTGAVFILEDCEVIIRKRENASNGALSALLNLTDGMLGQILKQKFILTFNTDRSNIDEALMRPGRLLYFKELEPLSRESAQKLADKLGLQLPDAESFTVAEVFNGAPKVGKKVRKQIGFRG